MNTLSPERSLRSRLYTVMHKALKAERQVGQMEGVRLIKGHWLVKSTVPVEFITLPSVPDSKGNSATSRYPYPKAIMEKLPMTSTKWYQPNFVEDYYAARPAEMEDWSLHRTFKTYKPTACPTPKQLEDG